MLISEFVEKYNEAKQKNAFVNKHIVTNYITYETKISLARNMVEISMYKDINGKKVFVPNTPMRYMLFVQALIDSYTDLEWDKTDDGALKVSESFNNLEKNGLVEIIIAAIGDDVTKLTTVLNMVVDDAVDANRSIVPFLETKTEAISMLFDTFSQALESPGIKEKIEELVNKAN